MSNNLDWVRYPGSLSLSLSISRFSAIPQELLGSELSALISSKRSSEANYHFLGYQFMSSIHRRITIYPYDRSTGSKRISYVLRGYNPHQIRVVIDFVVCYLEK